MPVLHLTLYRKWFDLIAAGSKVVEYREDSEHWYSRIFNKDGSKKHFDTIHFRNGYGKHRPLMVAEFLSAFVTHSSLCACDNGEKLVDGLVIVIAIGHKIRFENYQPPWRCGGCGVLVSLDESLCPACTAQLSNGGVAWTDRPEQVLPCHDACQTWYHQPCACMTCFPVGFCVDDPCHHCEGPTSSRCIPPGDN